MKKVLLAFAALLTVSFLSAQETGEMVADRQVELPTDSLGIHPWSGTENDNHIVIADQSHWSMYLTAGFNVFDGDFTHEKKHGVWVPTVGLGAAYHWNNTWSLGLEYKFRNYKVTGSGLERDADVLLKGMSHQADAYISLDVFNMFRPQNKSKLFALDLILGGGALWYKNSIYYPNEYDPNWAGRVNTDFKFLMHTGVQQSCSAEKYKATALLLAGVSAEFNINRSFQLGLRGVYHYTTTDAVDGRSRGNNNDGFFDCEILLRYKFEPRNKSNVRNFMVDKQIDNWNDGTYFEDPVMGKAKRDKYKIVPQKDTLFSTTRDTIYFMPEPVQSVRDTIYIMPQQPAQPVQPVRDTIYIMPQQIAQPVAPVVAPIVAPIPTEGTVQPQPQEPNDAGVARLPRAIRDYVVFFANDDPELDNAALNITGEAAMLLKQETDYKAVVVGSCDNTGAVEYNKWLAVQRATNVTQALIDLGIDSSRIYLVGRGIMQDDRSEGSFSVNRRVEINIVTDEQMQKAKEEYAYFEQYKQVKKGSAVRRAGEGKNVSSSEALKQAIEKMKNSGIIEQIGDAFQSIKSNSKEAATEVKTNATKAEEQAGVKALMQKAAEMRVVEEQPVEDNKKAEPLAVVTVTLDMTLSKLAKQYYGNGNYWIYIYNSNRDNLASPDQLREGMKLIIPTLEEGRKNMTKDELNALRDSLR